MKLTFLGAAREVTGSCTLLEIGGHYGLIDCGMEQGRDLFENIAIPVPAAQIEFVLVTHAHIDHAGAVGELADTLALPIIGPHTGDQFWIDGLAQQSTMFGFAPARQFTPTRWLQDGDTVQIGRETLNVRHCPGHTPGHVVFHAPQIERVFVGDVLFAGSIGRTDFPQGDHDQLISSITQRLWPMGNDTIFIPGHGPESSFGQERLTNPFVGNT